MAFNDEEKKELSELMAGSFAEALKAHDSYRAEEKAKADAAEADAEKERKKTPDTTPKPTVGERLLGFLR